MEEYIGTVKLFAGNFTPKYFIECNGATLDVRQHTPLFSLIGYTYGGSDLEFQVPNLTPPAAGLRWIICDVGIFPPRP